MRWERVTEEDLCSCRVFQCTRVCNVLVLITCRTCLFLHGCLTSQAVGICSLLLTSSWILSVYVVWGVQLSHYSELMCLSLSPVADVRSSWWDPLPVGAGRHSAPLLRSSRSPSFTSSSWSTEADAGFFPPSIKYSSFVFSGLSSSLMFQPPFPIFQIRTAVSHFSWIWDSLSI